MIRVGRRGFVRASAAAAAAATLGGPALAARPQESADGIRVRRVKPSAGRVGKSATCRPGPAARSGRAQLHLRAGINLIDTGAQYSGHEELVGKVLPKWREKVFVLDKWDPPLVTATVTKSALLEALDVSLQKLNTPTSTA